LEKHDIRVICLEAFERQNSVKSSRATSRIKVQNSSNIPGTDCVFIFRVLLTTAATVQYLCMPLLWGRDGIRAITASERSQLFGELGLGFLDGF
jgi:hypothetical protein